METPKPVTSTIVNIRDLRIGDIVCFKDHNDPLFVVGIFADAGTLGYQPEDGTGTVYLDFPDNPGDVLEAFIDEIEHVNDPEYLIKYREWKEREGE